MESEVPFLYQMPHSLDAEQAVLGAMLIDGRCIPEVIEHLKSQDFYTEQNREIYDTIYSMVTYSMNVDPVTVLEYMRIRGVYREGVSREYMFQLMDGTPTANNVEAYINILKDKSLLRRIGETAGELTALVQKGTETGHELLDMAEQRIYDIRQGRNNRGLLQLSSILTGVYNRLTELSDQNAAIPGLSTGLSDVDRAISGLNPSDLILLAARPGMGKTSMALNILLNVGKRSGKWVAFFSLEMSREQLALRLISSECFVDNKKLMTGRLSLEDWEKVVVATDALSHANILIDDDPSVSVADIAAQCRRVDNLGLVIVDYLQLMQSAGGKSFGGENRQQVVSEISRSFKILAKDLNVPVLCLSQLSRANESRSDKRPMLSDLRESGAIEQDADIVLFLYRDGYYNRESVDPNGAECIIAKNRHGETGMVELRWIPEFTTFNNLEWQHTED